MQHPEDIREEVSGGVVPLNMPRSSLDCAER